MLPLTLCLVTDIKSTSLVEYEKFILQAIEGGVTLVQLREKSGDKKQILERASALKKWLSPFKIPLIINDDIGLAKEIDAEGVHLGQSDTSPQEARRYLGNGKLIGLSIESLEELDLANGLTCIDYIAASAVFKSKTKLNCKKIWGIAGLQHLVQHSHHPVMAIGGISQDNVLEVMNSGASGIAVVSAIHGQENPKKAAQNLITIMKGKNNA